MKLKHIIPVMGALLLFACGASKERPAQEELRCGTYDTFVTNYDQPIDTTRAHISYCLYQQEGKLKQSTDSVTKRFLLSHIDEPDSLVKLPVDELLIAAVGNYFSSDYVASISELGGNMPPWYLEVNISYDTSIQGILAGTYAHSMYTGGAHPNGAELYCNFDLKTGNRLTLKDICSDVVELERRAEKIFREEQGIEATESLEEHGFWFADNTFHLTENFYIADGKLTFVFNQYEVAPYAMGVISIEIPLIQIRDILKVDI